MTAYYKIKAKNGNRLSVFTGTKSTKVGLYKEKNGDLFSYKLYQNFPNPSNPATIIRYTIPRELNVVLEVFDALGNKTACLVNETKAAGTHSVDFSVENLSSGIYFYSISTPNFYDCKKLLVVK